MLFRNSRRSQLAVRCEYDSDLSLGLPFGNQTFRLQSELPSAPQARVPYQWTARPAEHVSPRILKETRTLAYMD